MEKLEPGPGFRVLEAPYLSVCVCVSVCVCECL